ncbi:UNVERIFIED_CONTAM: hypothetical protein Slati_1890000 [Sesamum latifolium]|uniref:Nucleotide-diphospho-sugar transferase domain-containing protein n=1 Tax=Sesamum latifolium TaxID=2727402 RepID=A0AAW2X230_9LAMI
MDCRGGGSNSRSHSNLCEPSGNHQHRHHHFPSVVVKITILIAVVGLTRLALYQSGYHTQLMQRSYSLSPLKDSKQQGNPSPPSSTIMQGVSLLFHELRSKDVYGIDDVNKLKRTLKRAVMKDQNTVIITTVNAAWTEPNSIFDLFMKSFRIGNQTQNLLKHLVIVAFDQKAYSRCLDVHPHCFALTTVGVDFSGQAFFMSADYLKMMWRRIDFLRSILDMGYNFIFSDADIMWLRDPFRRFYLDGDFQIACDTYKYDSTNLHNLPNGGFTKDLDLVVTMHANCCLGLENKIHDIKMVIEDWKRYMGLMAVMDQKNLSDGSWTAPWRCGMKNSMN